MNYSDMELEEQTLIVYQRSEKSSKTKEHIAQFTR